MSHICVLTFSDVDGSGMVTEPNSTPTVGSASSARKRSSVTLRDERGDACERWDAVHSCPLPHSPQEEGRLAHAGVADKNELAEVVPVV